MATYKMGTASRAEQRRRLESRDVDDRDAEYTQSYGDRWLNNGITIKRGTSTQANSSSARGYRSRIGLRTYGGHLRRRGPVAPV